MFTIPQSSPCQAAFEELVLERVKAKQKLAAFYEDGGDGCGFYGLKIVRELPGLISTIDHGVGLTVGLPT